MGVRLRAGSNKQDENISLSFIIFVMIWDTT
jgi:hypothetical protein